MRHVVSLSLVFAVFFVACTPRPSAKEAQRAFASTLCVKAQECLGEGFEKRWPGGAKSCTDELVGARDVDDDASSACDDDEVATCRSDIKAQTCDVFVINLAATPPQMPKSCDKC